MTAATASYHADLDAGRQAIWIDLDDIVSADGLFEVMLHTMATKAGVVDWMPVLAQSGNGDLGMTREQLAQSRQQEFARLTNNPDRQWVVYLNSRCGGAGTNYVSVEGYQKFSDESGHNGWLDRTEPSKAKESFSPQTDSSSDFVELIDSFGKDQCPNIAFVLLCYERRESEKKATILDALGEDYKSVSVTESILGKSLSIDNIVENAIQWCDELNNDANEISRREHFLLALVSVNRVRSPSLLWSWAFHFQPLGAPESNFSERRRRSKHWLAQLETHFVIRRQSGGFIWMSSDIRRKLRKRLRERVPGKEGQVAKIHQGIAEWYGRLHVSSRSARAATEVAYHQCIRARFLIQGLRAETAQGDADFTSRQVLQALGAAVRILRQGRPSLLTDGFVQGTCRRLADLRNKQCREKILDRYLNEHGTGELQNSGPLPFPDFHKIRYAVNRLILTTYEIELEINQEIGNHRDAFTQLKEVSKIAIKEDVRTVCDEIRWRNKVATLNIAVRSTASSSLAIENVFERYGFPTESDRLGLAERRLSTDAFHDSIRRLVGKWLKKAEEKVKKKNRRYISEHVKLQLASGLIQTLQICMQKNLQEALYLRKNAARSLASPEENLKAPNLVQDALVCYDLAIEVKRAVQKDGIRRQEIAAFSVELRRDFGKDDASRWFDDQQRLDTQHALALSLSGDFEKAFRRLNEAEASLVEVRSSHGMEPAIIDLHRSFINLMRIAPDDTSPLSVAFKTNTKKGLPKDTAGHACLAKHLLCGALQRHQYNNVDIARIEDCWQSLERAQPILERYRKSAWWTTWNFEIRLRLIEAEVLSQAAHPSLRNLSYIGASAVPIGLPTAVDTLLDNSRRVIRMDFYQMAKIVESYSNCLLALSLWRFRVLSSSMTSPVPPCETGPTEKVPSYFLIQAHELHQREALMAQTLLRKVASVGRSTKPIGAIRTLENLVAARKLIDKEDSSTRASDAVLEYVRHVVVYSRNVAMFAKSNNSLLRFEPFQSENVIQY